MDEINKQQKCCDHTKEIEEIKLEHQKSIQIMLKSKTDDILFLLDENQRLLENERKFIKEIKILKEKNKKLSNELLNANKKVRLIYFFIHFNLIYLLLMLTFRLQLIQIKRFLNDLFVKLFLF